MEVHHEQSQEARLSEALHTQQPGGQAEEEAGQKSGECIKERKVTMWYMVKLYNHSEKAVEIKKGQKISQLVILPVLTPELTIVDSLEETERGNGGFGSTGKF